MLTKIRFASRNWQRSATAARDACRPLERYLDTLCEDLGPAQQLDFEVDGSLVTIIDKHGNVDTHDDPILAAIVTTYNHLNQIR